MKDIILTIYGIYYKLIKAMELTMDKIKVKVNHFCFAICCTYSVTLLVY